MEFTMNRSLQTARRGFTLVELLVVISIIAVLIAMFIPALQEAKKKAQSAVCKNQERQMGIALAVYNHQYRGYFPYACPYWTSDYGVQSTAGEFCWTYMVSPFLGNYKINDRPKVLACPSNPWVVVNNSTQRVNPASTYGLGSAYPTTGTATRGSPISTPMRRDIQLLTPSRTLLLGETPMGQNTEFGRDFEEGQFIDNRMFRTDNISYYGDAPAGYWYAKEFAAPAGTNPIARVNHNLGWNSLMSDGSVKYHTKAELIALTGNGSLGTGNDRSMFWRNQ